MDLNDPLGPRSQQTWSFNGSFGRAVDGRRMLLAAPRAENFIRPGKMTCGRLKSLAEKPRSVFAPPAPEPDAQHLRSERNEGDEGDEPINVVSISIAEKYTRDCTDTKFSI